MEEGWWRGKLGAKIGVFPSNFVSMVENSSPILANRRNNTTSVSSISTTASVTASTKHKSQSREDLVASTSNLLAALEKDAPILPPKPGNYRKIFLQFVSLFVHHTVWTCDLYDSRVAETIMVSSFVQSLHKMIHMYFF